MATRHFAMWLAGEERQLRALTIHRSVWDAEVAWKMGGTTVLQIHSRFPWKSSTLNQHEVYLALTRSFLTVGVSSLGQVHQNFPRYLRFRDYIQADLGQVMMMVLETAHLSSYSTAYDTEADSSLGTLDGTRAG